MAQYDSLLILMFLATYRDILRGASSTYSLVFVHATGSSVSPKNTCVLLSRLSSLSSQLILMTILCVSFHDDRSTTTVGNGSTEDTWLAYEMGIS